MVTLRVLWRSGLSARVPECKNIKKGGLDQYGAERDGRLILPQSEKVWVGLKGSNTLTCNLRPMRFYQKLRNFILTKSPAYDNIAYYIHVIHYWLCSVPIRPGQITVALQESIYKSNCKVEKLVNLKTQANRHQIVPTTTERWCMYWISGLAAYTLSS